MRILLLRTNLPHPHQSLGIPLGILYLAAALRRARPGRDELRVLDAGRQGLSVADLGRMAGEWEPRVVGLSALTPEASAVHAIAAAVRARAPGATVVVGGPHATAAPGDLLADPNIDVVCLGEGEQTFSELIDALDCGACLEGVAGLAVRDGAGQVTLTARRALVAELDSLPWPAWDLVDLPGYSRSRNMNGGMLAARPYAGLFTSRGCPHHCIYCHDVFGKAIRWRSAANVLDEVEHLYRERGVRELHVYDDIFNLDAERAAAICDGLLSRGLRLKLAFPNALRGDALERGLIEKLAAAGTYTACLAVETASPRLQKLLGKHLDLDGVSGAIEDCARAGILTIGYFMLGFPTETLDELRATVDFALRSRLHRASFFAVVPFPGTALERLARQHHPGYSYGRHFGYFSTESFYSWATGIDLGAIQRNAYRRFYLDPARLWALWRAYPSVSSFAREATAAAYCMLPGLHARRDRVEAGSVPSFLRRGA
jgi:radical SAM superfamily enzyme YgiQ (UPF0313 family)